VGLESPAPLKVVRTVLSALWEVAQTGGSWTSLIARGALGIAYPAADLSGQRVRQSAPSSIRTIRVRRAKSVLRNVGVVPACPALRKGLEYPLQRRH
jgi:hypothetical protein